MTPKQQFQRVESERLVKFRLVEIVTDKDTPPDKVLEKVKPLAEWILGEGKPLALHHTIKN